ncbi:hypothetical protein BAUCODRAFT_71035 [Baudoinia panamericana UAMH 10762]|uniref:PXA domain-containing protein n=1 Tax=Baudoinia panamericana (strain UAMH 10762) TaxID=717646 RepID=M2MWM7_BAUPA|nr:uncharacterized protein BAUCODRAFT_71035 [Baudoinia panamericana UAMH 10762]EMC95948.1 hypothetical protein BAUCODRAFT_71035 [Baudoinia panamericana UAMH 10762]
MDSSTSPQNAEADRPPRPSEGVDDHDGTGSAAGKRTTLSGTLQRFLDQVLHFLSHASNETLGACLVALGATTYFALGRIGLVILGVASGVVLQATWEGIRHDDRDEGMKQAEKEQRRQAGVEVAKRVLGWRTANRDEGEAKEDMRVYANQQLDFSSFGPKAAEAMDYFANTIIKDYVKYWYDPAIPGEESFPGSCKRTLIAFLLSLTGHLKRKRPADVFLDFVTNVSSIIIVFLNELSAALNASPNASAEDAVATYLALKPDSSLSYMLNQHSQEAKLADAAEDILQAYLDPKAYNCPPVQTLLKEVLAQLVLGYTVTYCSEPSWLNDWVVYGLEESATTKEVMDMVDAGVEGRVKEKAPPMNAAEQAETESRAEAATEEVEQQIPEPDHKRYSSKAEEAMDEAMREAQRLTQLMIEEDERRAKEEEEKQAALSSSEDVSDAVTTHGAPTPTSSQSDKDRQSGEHDGSNREQSATLASSTAVSSPPASPESQQFATFDQFSHQPTALLDSPDRSRGDPVQLTLHNATISIFDDSVPSDRTTIKTKPMADYMIQIEPSNTTFAGWMIARKYADFENLHEVLRRISVITGVKGFAQSHTELPRWRTNTKASLREELERYLTDAVRFQPLAESEGMKRFLEKDQGLAKSPSERNRGFGWPTPDAFGKFGGDMMNVLTKAPKQVAGGGKAVFGGVAGLVGGKRGSFTQASLSRTNTVPTADGTLHRSTPSLAQSPRPSVTSSARMSGENIARDDDTTASTNSTALSATHVPSLEGAVEAPVDLPPPPSEIPDDFGQPKHVGKKSTDLHHSANHGQSLLGDDEPPPTPPRPSKPAAAAKPADKPKQPLTERETSVAIELMFAVITELYTLSSAWQIRRTLLAAAKNFLLRPGNPTLITVRDMLQKSLLDDNLSDTGLAAHIYKLRVNALPTAEELEVWNRDYPEKTPEQKEELRVKARRLLVTKGMPQGLAAIMGAAASGEALGKVFDCLQVPEVSRGLVFGLVLQALRIVTH